MNEKFVNIKVDREERPDLDGIYMQAVQAMSGHGGWPMTMFLLPDGSPFYGGTYFPPDDRHGLPSFRRILTSVSEAYEQRRSGVVESADGLKQIYETNRARRAQRRSRLSPQLLETAHRSLAQRYDDCNGGFGGAPKFPATMTLDFLLRYWKRTGTRGRPRDGLEFLSTDGARGHIRPDRRWIRAIRGRCDLARPPFREDALRQRASRASRSASLPGDEGCRGSAGHHRDRRMGRPRDDVG